TTTRSSKSTFPCRTADPAGTATAASNNTDRPTPGTGTESIVGWSTPRVGHRARPRCTPHSAAGKTPTALHQAHRHGVDRRVVNASRWPPCGGSGHTALGDRKDADRP